jgi:hypothetical protein
LCCISFGLYGTERHERILMVDAFDPPERLGDVPVGAALVDDPASVVQHDELGRIIHPRQMCAQLAA